MKPLLLIAALLASAPAAAADWPEDTPWGKRIAPSPLAVTESTGHVVIDWPAIKRCAEYKPTIGGTHWATEWDQVFQCRLMMDARTATLQGAGLATGGLDQP